MSVAVDALLEMMRTPLVRSRLACVCCARPAFYLCALCPSARSSLCRRSSCAITHARLKHEHPTPANNDLPEPKLCPVCSRRLSPVFQTIETIKASFHRLRHVCTSCGIAVVLHRLPNQRRRRARARKNRGKRISSKLLTKLNQRRRISA